MFRKFSASDLEGSFEGFVNMCLGNDLESSLVPSEQNVKGQQHLRKASSKGSQPGMSTVHEYE